jgi:hypothetical protein
MGDTTSGYIVRIPQALVLSPALNRRAELALLRSHLIIRLWYHSAGVCTCAGITAPDSYPAMRSSAR